MLANKLPKDDLNKILEEAVFNFNRKNFIKSSDLFYDVLKKDPDNPEANYYLGLIFSREENFDKAIMHLRAVADQNINFLYTQQCRMILGYIYFKMKEYKKAEEEFLEVSKSRMKIVQVYAALSSIKYYLNKKDEALDYAEKAYDMDSFNLNIKNTYGFLLCDYEIDIDKGLEMLREIIRLKPGNAAYLDSLGWAYFKKGDKKAAKASLKKALTINENKEIRAHLKLITAKAS